MTQKKPQRRKGRTQYAILGFLANKPRSGYDLKKAIEKSVGFFWSESYGQIYPILARLVEKGLITKLPKDTSTGRNRQQYAITPEGETELQKWIRQTADDPTFRNELLLKLFFGSHAEMETSLTHLDDFLTHQRELLATFSGFKSTLPDAEIDLQRHHLFLSATLDYGIVMTNAAISWAEETIARFNKNLS